MTLSGEAPNTDILTRLVSGYRPLPGVPDELLQADGTIRPVWAPLLGSLAQMSSEEIGARIARGDQYLRDSGVYYRQYGPDDITERDWPLSHFPILISSDEWAQISAGLAQRADLLERVVADIYGDNTLVSDGHLPAELVANNPEWLRPLVGVKPRLGHFLHFLAFDIGRGPQGQWWVLGDRTQAPSGAGFALENRIATTRVFNEVYAHMGVQRLAGFFRVFRDALLGLRENDGSRVGILTPGPMNDTYYEHAYIARYLGFTLLEGEDLTVHDGELMVRTVAGLKPVSVLWRRLDAAWADPLELDETSQLGTPGLLNAVRSGSVTMVNALGSGVLETRAFLAFLPRISEALTGEPLAIPNIATWWCGQEKEREHVKANAQAMSIGSAYATRLLFDHDDVSAIGGTFDREMHESLMAWIEHGAGQLVGQEAVNLSTAPALEDGVLVPRPMSLRVFLARTPDGWQAMPGGYARIGHSGSSLALAMQRGGSAADVWVLNPGPASSETMLSSPAKPFVRQQPGVLPSRAADNLYWLGRYVERFEYNVRLLRAYHLRLDDAPSGDTPLLAYIGSYLFARDCDPEAVIPTGLTAALASASIAAEHVRDRFSLDGWMALADLSRTAAQMRSTSSPGGDAAQAMRVLLRKISGFSGLVHENMYRLAGWRFLSIGRALERAGSLTSLLAHFADEEAPDGSFDLAIEVADSAMTHRRRYTVATARATVIDLLALDPLNPRSIIYQLNEITEHVRQLPGMEEHRQLSPLQRGLLHASSELALQTPEDLSTPDLLKLGNEIAGLSELLGAKYLR